MVDKDWHMRLLSLSEMAKKGLEMTITRRERERDGKKGERGIHT